MEDPPHDGSLIEKTTAELLVLTYDELRALARRKLASERPGHTLQATALVHEVYLRLSRSTNKPWDNERHFFVAATEAMRRILIENARSKKCQRRGGAFQRTEIEVAEFSNEGPAELVLGVEAALCQFERIEPLKAQLVRMRFYTGLSIEEAASVLGFSAATAKRHWRYSKAWLHQHMLESTSK